MNGKKTNNNDNYNYNYTPKMTNCSSDSVKKSHFKTPWGNHMKMCCFNSMETLESYTQHLKRSLLIRNENSVCQS